MKRTPCALLVEADILVRHPLAEYLRDCGFRVVQAASTDEARKLLTQRRRIVVDVMLIDVGVPGSENTFALCRWVRDNHPSVQVIMAGTPDSAAQKAGELCEKADAVNKPYDHQLVVDRIRRLLAARDQGMQ